MEQEIALAALMNPSPPAARSEDDSEELQHHVSRSTCLEFFLFAGVENSGSLNKMAVNRSGLLGRIPQVCALL